MAPRRALPAHDDRGGLLRGRVGRCAGQVFGGAACDALIAFTVAEHQATLLSLDQRAGRAPPTVPRAMKPGFQRVRAT